MPRSKKQFEEIRERTRAAILDAGMKLFAQKGYVGASMSEIAKEAGVSKGLTYNYFKSKEKLAEAIIAKMMSMFDVYGGIFTEQISSKEKLEKIIKKTFSLLRQNEELWRLYIGIIAQPDMAIMSKEIFGKIFKGFVTELEKIFKDIGYSNAKTEAYLFGASIDGITIDYLYNRFYFHGKYPLAKIEKLLIEKYCH